LDVLLQKEFNLLVYSQGSITYTDIQNMAIIEREFLTRAFIEKIQKDSEAIKRGRERLGG
jgi:hypothetical protein